MAGQDKKNGLDTILERLESMNVTLLQCKDDINTCNTNIQHCNQNLENTVLPRLTAAEADIKKMKTQIKQLQDRQADLENYMKRDNLIFGGISESSPENCLEKIQHLITKNLKLDIEATDIKFQRVHRLGKKQQGKTRPIIARFLWFNDRQKVWKSRNNLSGTPFWMSEDYTKEVQQNRKVLRPVLQGAIASGTEENPVSAYLILDRLYTQDNMYTVDTLDSLPADLKPEVLATPKIGENYVAFFNKSSPLSNFYPAEFQLDNKQFKHVEQYFQYKKALLCGYPNLAADIANESCPYQCKSLVKKVKLNNDWKKQQEEVMRNGCSAKFLQNPELMQFLRDTEDRTIVEARSDDKFWGAGLHVNDKRFETPTKWPGKNKLGQILMDIRQ